MTDEPLADGSCIMWSKRTGNSIPVRYGCCGVVRKRKITGNLYRLRQAGAARCGSCASRASVRPRKELVKAGNGYIRRNVETIPDKDLWLIQWETLFQNRYISEHRYQLARKLRRPLEKNETAHHKNGNRSDNRWGNLELRAVNHGRGATARRKVQCPCCKTIFSVRG